jgi:hypothetical protein
MDDPALSNAVMFTLAFGVSGGNFNQENLIYQNKAIKCIRERMSFPGKAATIAILGAILLLAGVEVKIYAISAY